MDSKNCSNLQGSLWSISGGFWKQLGVQNRPKIHRQSIENRINFGIHFLDQCLTVVASILEAKLAGKFIQNWPKIDPRDIRFGHRFGHPFVIDFWWKLDATAACRHAKNIEKQLLFKGFCYIGNFVLMSCWLHFLVFFLIFRGKQPLKLYLK